jgi:hypothetical protein
MKTSAMDSAAKWLQWSAPDTAYLSGKSVFEFLQPLLTIAAPEFVIVDVLAGAVFGLRGVDRLGLATKDFMSKVSDADQYDWAFFYFFKERLEEDCQDESDRCLIGKSDFTVRLADSSYFYVYSANKMLNEYLSFSLAYGKKKITRLSDLDIMY